MPAETRQDKPTIFVRVCVYTYTFHFCVFSFTVVVTLYFFRSWLYEKKIFVLIYSSYLRVVVVVVVDVVIVSYQISGFLVHFMLQMWLRYVCIFPVHFIWFILYERVCVCVLEWVCLCAYALIWNRKGTTIRHWKSNAYIKGTKAQNWYFLRDLISRRRQHGIRRVDFFGWSLFI